MSDRVEMLYAHEVFDEMSCLHNDSNWFIWGQEDPLNESRDGF